MDFEPFIALMHVLVALVVIVLSSKFLGTVFRMIHQPPVMGEVMAGILLGPSFFGHLNSELANFIFPVTIIPYLSILSQLAIIFFMFIVGLELNVGEMKRNLRSCGAISLASIVAPLIAGIALAPALGDRFVDGALNFRGFPLFIGVAMAITAFPVLARIIKDKRLEQSRLGAISLGCAAMNDTAAWCLLASALGIAQDSVGGALRTLLLAWLFCVGVYAVVRPIINAATARLGRVGPSRGMLTATTAGILIAAWTTNYIGIHALFGPFLLGAVLPPDRVVILKLTTKLEKFVVRPLLPVFFALVGLRTQIDVLQSTNAWIWCGVITLVAVLSKAGGAMFAARWSGFDWRSSVAIGAMMNTRGLMELIVLNAGLDRGLISPQLYAMFVVMTLATTLATGPVLSVVLGRQDDRRQFQKTTIEVPPRRPSAVGSTG